MGIVSQSYLMILTFFLFSLGMAAASSAGQEAQPTTLPDPLDEMVWWLPDDTQTLVVAEGPIKLGDLDQTQSPRISLVGAHVFLLADAVRSPRAGGHEGVVAWAVGGSRKCRYHEGLTGLMLPYEGAQIILFRDDLGALAQTLMTPTKGSRSRREMLAGNAVVVEENEYPNGTGVYEVFMTNPKPNLLIYATNRDYLQTTLQRMAARGKVRALPENLPEWKHVDMTSPFWALRHFDRADASSDPTSPFATSPPARGEHVWFQDHQAVGMVFGVSPNKDGVARITYLSNNPIAVDIATQRWAYPRWLLQPAIGQVEFGVVGVSVSLKVLEDKDLCITLLLRVFQNLGYVIVI
jgi:hypothetical protein